MPFLKNAEKQICQVYDTELKPLLEKGWKELTTEEEIIYRQVLKESQSLTSAKSIELARVKAGLYKVLGPVEKAVETAVKGKVATVLSPKTTKKVTSSKGSKTNATK